MTEASISVDTAATTSNKTGPVKPAWVCLIVAWILFLLPVPFVGLFIGWPLNLVAFILAIVIMSKGLTKKGLIPLLASLIVSPIVYFIGVAILAGMAVSGVAQQEAVQAAAPPATQSAPRVEVTARALFAAYDANEVAADSKYKGKPLLVSGVVESIDSDLMDNPDVLLKTQPFQAVHAQGLSTDEAAQLAKGESITMACTGGGEVMGSPMLEDCALK